MANKAMNGPLATAAAAFEEELARYRELASELRGNPMNTQKAIGRAKGSLQESVESEQRMTARLSSLSQALNTAREQQVSLAADTLESAKRVQARVLKLNELMDRFAALGEKARAIQEPLAVAQGAAEPSQAEAAVHAEASLREVTARMESLIDEAHALGESADADDWKDLGRDAISLKQQVQAARNKALLILRKLPPGASS